jgi:hypothetical protein
MHILNEIELLRQHRDWLVGGHERLTRQLWAMHPQSRFWRTR